MYPKSVLMIAIITLLSGCATPGVYPVSSNIDKSKVFDALYDQVWSAIISSIAESNLGITTLEKESGIIAISNTSYEPSWANEGTRGNAMGAPDEVVQRDVTFNIFATAQGSDQTLVQVNSSFKMKIRTGNGSQAFPHKFQWHKAYSNGTLEKILHDKIKQKL